MTVSRVAEILEGGWASLSSSFMDALSSTPSKLSSAWTATPEHTSQISSVNGDHKTMPTSPTQKTPSISSQSAISSAYSSHIDTALNVSTPTKPVSLDVNRINEKRRISDLDSKPSPSTATLATDDSHPLDNHDHLIYSSESLHDTGQSSQLSVKQSSFGGSRNSPSLALQSTIPPPTPSFIAVAETEQASSSSPIGFGDWEDDAFLSTTSNASLAPSSSTTTVLPSELDTPSQVSSDVTSLIVSESDATTIPGEFSNSASASIPDAPFHSVPSLLLETSQIGESHLLKSESPSSERVTDVDSELRDPVPTTAPKDAIPDESFVSACDGGQEEPWTPKEAAGAVTVTETDPVSAAHLTTNSVSPPSHSLDSDNKADFDTSFGDSAPATTMESAPALESPLRDQHAASSSHHLENMIVHDSKTTLVADFAWNGEENGWNDESTDVILGAHLSSSNSEKCTSRNDFSEESQSSHREHPDIGQEKGFVTETPPLALSSAAPPTATNIASSIEDDSTFIHTNAAENVLDSPVDDVITSTLDSSALPPSAMDSAPLSTHTSTIERSSESEHVAAMSGDVLDQSSSTPLSALPSSSTLASQVESSNTHELTSSYQVSIPVKSQDEAMVPSPGISRSPSASDSSSVKHLQSKLDVLTRILDERERQLASRSTVMADLQNENEKLKSELEAFKSAQTRVQRGTSGGSSSFSSYQGSTNMIEALQTEFSERIAAMETKYRTTVKDRDRLLEQLKTTNQQLEVKSKQLEAMRSEMEALGVFGSSTQTSTFSSSSISNTNTSIVDSAMASLSSLLLSPQAQESTLKSNIIPSSASSSAPSASPLSAVSLSTIPVVLSDSSSSLVQSGSSSSLVKSSSSSSPLPSIDPSAAPIEGVSSSSLGEDRTLQEKVKRYEGALREFLSREKVRTLEKSSLDSRVSALESELDRVRREKDSSVGELEKLRESERRVRVAFESQREALSQKVSALDLKSEKCESLDREVSGLKSELESSWRVNDSLKKELVSVRSEEEERRNELETRLKSQHSEAMLSLQAKSLAQQMALQTTIAELRSALDGNTRLKSTQEEALEVRIAELESAHLQAEQLLASARQSSEVAQTPLLKQIADLQLQVAHLQRAMESAEEAWKARAQTLEHALTAASHDFSHAQSQQRIAEQTQHKLQTQYARLEHTHQTLQIEHEHLTQDLHDTEEEREKLATQLENAQTQMGTLNTRCASLKGDKEELVQRHAATVARLETQVQHLQARIQSITTPGSTSASNAGPSSLALPSSSSSSTSVDPSSSSIASSSSSPASLSLSPMANRSSPNLPSNHVSSSSPIIIAKSSSQHALQSQISLLRAEKTRFEELLANQVQTSAQNEEMERNIEMLQHERTQLQERLEAALELVAEQSERLQYMDEEIAETKQLYKEEIANLVSQLQIAQTRLKDYESLPTTARK